jgi:hypothetical protein
MSLPDALAPADVRLPVWVKLRRAQPEHILSALPPKATAGGSPLQIGPRHGALSAARFPRQNAGEATGKRWARGPLGWWRPGPEGAQAASAVAARVQSVDQRMRRRLSPTADVPSHTSEAAMYQIRTFTRVTRSPRLHAQGLRGDQIEDDSPPALDLRAPPRFHRIAPVPEMPPNRSDRRYDESCDGSWSTARQSPRQRRSAQRRPLRAY